jgi:3-phenylpropionate/cinnamic acid dioxygenase small subunit
MNLATANSPVQQLLDRHEVTDLVYRLGECLDEGRFDELRSLFVEEATARTPGGTAEGREALIAQARRNHSAEDRIQHVTTNLRIDLEDDNATVRANLVVHFAPPTDERALAPQVRFTVGEVYHFAVTRTPEGWRFASVETEPVWMSGTRGRPQPD